MNTPKIRFKGFEDHWEQRKLRENLSFLKDGTHGTHKDVEDGPLLLSAKNIKNGTVQWDESDRRISEDEFKSIHANFKLKEGDVLLTIVGSIGETAILNNSEGITFQRSVAFLRPASKIISEFLYSEIQGYKFQKELNERKSTSAQPGIYLSDLGEIPISYPINMDEQVAIGHYFTNIDHLITLHQRKCDETKQLKKFMLQNMFPKNGEKNPEIRFEGFTDDWEQRKLGEVVGIYDGVHQTPQYQDSGIMFLSVENITTLKSEKYISEEAFERDYKVYPQKGDILMTRIGDVGTTNVVQTTGKVAFYVSLALLKPKEINSYFLSNAMKTSVFQKGLRERTLVTAIPQKINKDEIGRVNVFITNNAEEQKKIEDYFTALDHLITLHQRKCEKLKALKKFMLQNMFI
jgi:type I restriction enzyme S subunit